MRAVRLTSTFWIPTLLSVAACSSAASAPATAPTTAGADAGTTPALTGKTFPSAADAPSYDGKAYKGMQIYDLERDVYLDDQALVEALDSERLVFFGEQHETAPVQELELWLLQKSTDRHEDVTLAMEHFQHDEQSILDDYVAGKMSTADFEKKSQPWQGYQTYWKPLVEHMKSLGRPIVGLNVPDEALDMIYSAYPKKPLDVFNGWNASFKYDAAIAPRPIGKWDATYEKYFDGSFDYKTHGAQMGMSPADALLYFTDLAHIRDETMAYFTSQAVGASGHVLVVAGDWHVQTGLATPDRTLRYHGDGSTCVLVTTTPESKLDEVKQKLVSGRKLARYVLVYRT